MVRVRALFHSAEDEGKRSALLKNGGERSGNGIGTETQGFPCPRGTRSGKRWPREWWAPWVCESLPFHPAWSFGRRLSYFPRRSNGSGRHLYSACLRKNVGISRSSSLSTG